MRTWAEIDGAALRHNLREARRRIPARTKIFAVVKANAYGHGLTAVTRELLTAGADWIGVATLEEALTLRQNGLRAPTLLFSAALREEFDEAIRHDVRPTLSSLDEARAFNRAAARLGKKARFHFKIDTGMGRLGAWHEDAAQMLDRMRKLPSISLEGIYTHFASSSEDPPFTRMQWERFDRFVRREKKILCHAANSGALVSGLPCALDLVRPGIMIYGALTPSRQQPFLRPALTWKSRIIFLREVGRGRTLSYGATYRVPRRQKIATVAVGYADGYPRLLSNRGHVLVNGVRCPIRGRVTMDQILIDVSRAPAVKTGGVVTLLGREGGEEISAVDLARETGTISYEILTGIGPRVTRVYRGFKTERR